jgi:hypothetical protein
LHPAANGITDRPGVDDAKQTRLSSSLLFSHAKQTHTSPLLDWSREVSQTTHVLSFFVCHLVLRKEPSTFSFFSTILHVLSPSF